jgi:hypothetical protein
MADPHAPSVIASTFTDIASAVRAYIETAKSTAVDGLTWAEFGELLVGLLRLAVRLADLLNVSGDERKAIVLDAAAALFDSVADRCVPLWFWPLWMICRGPTRALVLALASGAIEVILPLVRSAAT